MATAAPLNGGTGRTKITWRKGLLGPALGWPGHRRQQGCCRGRHAGGRAPCRCPGRIVTSPLPSDSETMRGTSSPTSTPSS